MERGGVSGLRGVDLSASYQPAEDFGQVHAAGYSFAILKASEGTTWPDNPTLAGWYPQRVKAAEDAGLIVGAYHFAHPGQVSPQAEAAWFLRCAQPQPGDVVPFLDVETNAERLDPADLTAWCRAWLAAVDTATGGRGGVYTYVSFLREQLGGWNLDGRPLWLADPSNVAPAIPRAITQTGQAFVPGIGANVDENVASGPLPIIGAPAAPPASAPAEPAPADWTPTVRDVDLSHATRPPYVTGPGVRPLQVLLRQYQQGSLAVDGQGGPATLAALRAYQGRMRLAVDGIAGPATFDSLLSQS